jgi:hypothetical protein
MVWDKGKYFVPEGVSEEIIDKQIEAGLQKGHLSFI